MPQAPECPDNARPLFVYGTLRAGGRNDIARWRPAASFIGPARIAGTLYDLGTYPGATLGGAGVVVGEVYLIGPDLEAQLDLLEEVQPDGEGEYRKRCVPVAVNGQLLDCLVYEIHPRRIAGRPVMTTGDWLAR